MTSPRKGSSVPMSAKRDWPEFAADDTPLDQIVKLSHYYGSDPRFVIAGGGNTSVKEGRVLHVKASGSALATITAEGFAALHRDPLDRLLATEPDADVDAREARFKKETLDARVHPEKGQRPSVESVIHHLLPARFVVHTHSTVVNMVTCCMNGEAVAREIFGDGVVWVPYVDPGFVLSKEVKKHHDAWCARHGRPFAPAILMGNHGLIICGETPEEIRTNTDAVLGPIREHLEKQGGAREPFGATTLHEAPAARRLLNVVAPALRGLLAGEEPLRIVTFDGSGEARSLAGGADGRAVATAGPLTPDQIVYCTSFPLWFRANPEDDDAAIVERLREAIATHARERRFPPRIVILEGVGILAAGDNMASAATTRDVYNDAVRVMAGARRMGGVSHLPDARRLFIEDWEVEAYRRKVSAARTAGGRAAGKVALVTGAAQGFGLEIAQHLAAEGANVILADVNLEGAANAARDLEEGHGPGRVLAVEADVTGGPSIQEAVDRAVRLYGGIDLLVANAGVVRAGSVKELAERDFDFVTDVNYKGYFLSVQKVAPVMAVQHLAAPGRWFDIIQINSKSGLTGSNRNGAYAGSKFGGLGLTQSFALELVADGIKVNAICPGNFFDGPLWSDPEKGLFVQYLRSGKVPGAKTIDDVKKAYESKIPMGRGCTTPDVMKAIHYLLDQNYETGQAIPVTGGQVMLH